MKQTDSAFSQPIAEQIWNSNYRLQTPNPDIMNDEKVEDTWYRVANACANSLPGDSQVDEFYSILQDFKFLPGGRILAGIGSGRDVALFNCFVMENVPDHMKGIFKVLRENALTLQSGGGTGNSFSLIRPKNAPVRGVDANASGPTSFMDCWDTMCKTVESAGARRGAMMATLICNHPDIHDFITVKRDPLRMRNFNLSVLVTDLFMEAVDEGKAWPLVHAVAPLDTSMGQLDPATKEVVYDHPTAPYIYETVDARELWELIMKSTYEFADPGILFIDRINRMNNLWYLEKIMACNPCGEQPLPPNGACLLGSLNLTRFVIDPFTAVARIDFDEIRRVAAIAVRLLDSIIDISKFPLEEQKAEALEKRRMGIGVTGLADMLLMVNMKYGCQRSLDLVENIMKAITIACYTQSNELAQQYGPCPATDTTVKTKALLSSGFMKSIESELPKKLKSNIENWGLRNALLISVAPQGTNSLYAGNVSSGIEPIFAAKYNRKVIEPDGFTRRTEEVEDYAVKLFREYLEDTGKEHATDGTPSFLVTAQTLDPDKHLAMQATVQKWVDSSISKTINCPVDIEYDEFKAIYMKAWTLGCKGCTTYRPNDITGSVISVDKEEEPKETPTVPVARSLETPMSRLQELSGSTYKLKWNGSNVYVTINNHWTPDSKTIPFEIFINSRETAHYQWTVALTRMMSAVFRRGGDVSFIVDELRNVFDPNGGNWVDGKYIPSFIALLGETLKTHMISIGYLTGEAFVQDIASSSETHVVGTVPLQCGECKGYNVHISEGCPTCGDCGHSKCG